MRVSLMLLLAACAGSPRSASGLDRVPNGDWGGEHVRLTVDDTGGKVEFDCAHGSLLEPLTLDAQRPLRRQGQPGRGGRARAEGRARELATRPLSRQTDGQQMSLEVTLESGESAGTFSLARSGPARLRQVPLSPQLRPAGLPRFGRFGQNERCVIQRTDAAHGHLAEWCPYFAHRSSIAAPRQRVCGPSATPRRPVLFRGAPTPRGAPAGHDRPGEGAHEHEDRGIPAPARLGRGRLGCPRRCPVTLADAP